jgi:hypothetical protein
MIDIQLHLGICYFGQYNSLLDDPQNFLPMEVVTNTVTLSINWCFADNRIKIFKENSILFEF